MRMPKCPLAVFQDYFIQNGIPVWKLEQVSTGKQNRIMTGCKLFDSDIFITRSSSTAFHCTPAIAKLGAGYMQAIPDSQIFILENDKGYVKKNNFGRAQAILNFGLSLQKQFTKPGGKIFLEYQQRLQVPFIPSYVPVLPYNILMIGCSFPMHK
jgi:hypothetical protein